MRLVRALVRAWGRGGDLLFPRSCLICHRKLLHGEQHLCLHCLYALPRTHYHRVEGSKVEQIFYGRVEVERALAWCYFSRGSSFRQLIHRIKYAGERGCAYYLGYQCAKELYEAKELHEVDVVVPIPLHPLRYLRRGYNQSYEIARGVAKVLGKPVAPHALRRKGYASTQTHKSLYERWHNPQLHFDLARTKGLAHCHILLVDDVVTSGATLLAATECFAQLPHIKISLLTIAIAD